MRYSLADYILSIKIPDSLRGIFTSTDNESDNRISIGGDGSYLGSIKVSTEEIYKVEGDATGSWIHTKSKNKTGSLSVEISQLADSTLKLTRLFETYFSADTITEGLTITISKAVGSGNSSDVCTLIDCYISQMPDGSWEESAKTMEWKFVCGKITYSGDAM